MAAELAHVDRVSGVRRWLDEAMVLARRELRDSLRDWRIVIPIVILTLIFPALMQVTAGIVVDWMRHYGGSSLLIERTYPFLLMMVGFFPLSFSLVIALEAFVGEKERKSLEPLLATPLSDGQLYFGKMVSSLIPTVGGSYLGISVYLVAMALFRDWRPSLDYVALVIALTTAKAVVMVSGAVIVSSQATSVRAANLLASFILIPMALLVQAESLAMFWADYPILWWVVVLLAVVDVLLVRMGLQLFDREELLGREIDEMNLASLWRTFLRFWARVEPDGPVEPVTLGRLYRRDVPAVLRRLRAPSAVVCLALAAAVLLGAWYADQFRLPRQVFNPGQISLDAFQGASIGFLPTFSASSILLHNLRVLLIAAALAVFSFGSLSIVLLMAPIALIGYVAGTFAHWGYSPLVFVAAFILPHGIFEMPAAILITAAALRLGAVFITRQVTMTISEGWLAALADLVKVFVFVGLPLLIVAAVVEAVLTLRIVMWVYGIG